MNRHDYDGRGNPYSNPDLVRRDPRTWDRFQPPAPAGDPSLDMMPGAFGFDFINRVAYTAPPTTGLFFILFTVGQDIRGGYVTGIGIGTAQYDWFGTNEYFFALNDSQPYDHQVQQSGGPSGTAGSSFAFAPVGTIKQPAPVNIKVMAADRFQLGIRPQAVPAAGTVRYNIIVRTRGYFFK